MIEITEKIHCPFCNNYVTVLRDGGHLIYDNHSKIRGQEIWLPENACDNRFAYVDMDAKNRAGKTARELEFSLAGTNI